mgnify:CR=1 FL=1
MVNEKVVEGVVGGVDEKRGIEDGEEKGLRAESDDFERVGEGERFVAREEAELIPCALVSLNAKRSSEILTW